LYKKRLLGSVNDALISNIDIPATILHLAGLQQHIDRRSQARSLLPMLSSAVEHQSQPFRHIEQRHVLITEFIAHSLGCCDPIMSIRDQKVSVLVVLFRCNVVFV
jgi:arylsulfatase A-like enzyme